MVLAMIVWVWRTAIIILLVSVVLHGVSLDVAFLMIVAVLNERVDTYRLRRQRALSDLREIYWPRRDRFHRDLERLERLRTARPLRRRVEGLASLLDQDGRYLIVCVFIVAGFVVLAAWCIWGLVLFL